MLSMPPDDRFYIRFAIGEKIIHGTGARLSRTAGAYQAMCMIAGTSRIRDVLVMALMLGTVVFLASIVRSRIS